MNIVMFTGRLTADPEVRNNNGNVVATFNLAIDRPKKDANGNWTHEADYARCILFGKRAEWFGNNAKKGYEVFVEASFKSGQYTKQSGEKVYTNDFWCSDVKVIGVPKTSAPQTQAPPVQNANAIPNGVNNSNLPWNSGQQAPAQATQTQTPAPTPAPAPQTTQPSAPTPNMQPTYNDPYGGFVDNGFAPYS